MNQSTNTNTKYSIGVLIAFKFVLCNGAGAMYNLSPAIINTDIMGIALLFTLVSGRKDEGFRIVGVG